MDYKGLLKLAERMAKGRGEEGKEEYNLLNLIFERAREIERSTANAFLQELSAIILSNFDKIDGSLIENITEWHRELTEKN